MPRDFSSFDIEDFAFDETFQNWVLDEVSSYRNFWEQYMDDNPHQTEKILAARTLVQELNTVNHGISHDAFAREIWENVQRRIQTPARDLWSQWSVWRVAASISFLIMLGTSLWWLRSGRTDANQQAFYGSTKNGLVEEVNNSDRTLQIRLSDGSVVSLGKKSRLAYPSQFEKNQRVVYLSGEAFFDIQKNPDRPFLVYANETVTKVLGTSFRIKAFKNSPKVIVAVRSGLVSVFAKKDFEDNPQNAKRTGLVLTPNQQGVFSRDDLRLSKTLVEQPVLLSPASQEPLFEFNNAPVSEIFTVLEKAYGVEIVYDGDLLAGRELTVSMEDESLYEKLDIVCKTLGLAYEIVDTQVIIESKAQRSPK
ncbi:FecR family protein [Dyadobacter arcticus]|uniref:Ferric-dicitrate binding protein FerR (Iron transport regulator) n=1 Tax=Dyadobacter arcticus TaxID=1078754 RepID=A0ABX0UNS8_9BACT|nr:FecR family protein [Dyadobacter arcticus]NIJ54646.1 ferric-dicitrate binding protein FerR (iron transport regulator) [Dyadobacter arcticus]